MTGLADYTASAATVATVGTALQVTRTGASPYIQSPTGKALAGRRARYVWVRAVKTAGAAPGASWVGSLKFATSAGEGGAHGISSSHRKDIAAPSGYALGQAIDLIFDMHALTAGGDNWRQSTIDQLRLELDNDVGSVWQVYVVTPANSGPQGFANQDDVLASQAKLTSPDNMLLDYLLADPDYWFLGAGWSINSTDTDVTGFGAGKLNLPRAFKTPVGAATTTYALLSDADGQYLYVDVEPGVPYRLGARVSVEPNFKGYIQIGVEWHKRDPVTGALTFISTSLGGDTAKDYRTTTLGGSVNGIHDIALAVRAPTLTAGDNSLLVARWFARVDWGPTPTGHAYVALPVMRSAFDLGVWAGSATTSSGSKNTNDATTTWTPLFYTPAVLSTGALLNAETILNLKPNSAASKAFKLRFRVFAAAGFNTSTMTGTLLATGTESPVFATIASTAGAVPFFFRQRFLNLAFNWVVVVIEIANNATTAGSITIDTDSVMRTEDSRTRSN